MSHRPDRVRAEGPRLADQRSFLKQLAGPEHRDTEPLLDPAAGVGSDEDTELAVLLADVATSLGLNTSRLRRGETQGAIAGGVGVPERHRTG